MQAWVSLLSSDDYYVYMLLGLYKNLQDSKTRYPFYCGVTPDISQKTRNILMAVGIKLIDLDIKLINNKVIYDINAAKRPYWVKAVYKLLLLDTKLEKMFDKIVYLDTDIQVNTNIDEIFKKPHMSAVGDVAPYKKISDKYKVGDSIFCSGMFVWDFKENPGFGHKILTELINLDIKVRLHDQAILNFYYKDWNKKRRLQMFPSYCLMNINQNLIKISNPKCIHWSNRVTEHWPFVSRVYISQSAYDGRYYNFKTYVKSLNDILQYYNKLYKFNLPRLYYENIIIISDNADTTNIPNAHLYLDKDKA